MHPKVPHVLVCAAAACVGAGCSTLSDHMTYVDPPDAPETRAPPPGRSLVLFFRDSFFGSVSQARLFKNGEYVGTVSSGSFVAIDADPGEILFMIASETGDFMSGELTADHTYFVLVRPRMGVWKARFSLVPFGPEHQQWSRLEERFAELQEGTINSEGHEWGGENAEWADQIYEDIYFEWREKPDAPHLFPEWGIAHGQDRPWAMLGLPLRRRP